MKNWAGFSFPGLDPDLIDEAKKNFMKALRSRIQIEILLSNITPMNEYGEVIILEYLGPL